MVKNKSEKFLALIYNLKQYFTSNLDLLYFLSIFCIFKDKNIIIKSIKYILPIILYGIFQIVLKEGDINYIKLIVNIVKIYLCILLFIYVKTNINKIKIDKIVYCSSILLIFFTLIALILKNNETLWIFNDITNYYNQTRLRLFYSEASELAFHTSLIIIMIAYLNFKCYKMKNIIHILLLILVIYLSAGLSATITLIISLLIMVAIKFFKRLTKKTFLVYYFGGLLFIILSFLYLNSNSSLVLRMEKILNGADSSTNYRLLSGYNVMNIILEDTKMVGVGFGNLNTDDTSIEYESFGLVRKIANSFMYFISEGGIFAIMYLIIFYLSLFKNINRKNCILKIPLLFFIVVYQVGGGYFTNPTNWIVCGFIASNADLLIEREDEGEAINT